MTPTVTQDGPLSLDAERAEARIQSWLAKADKLLLRLEQAQTHYAVLNLDLGASAAEITTAYRETVIGLTRAFNDLRDAVPGGRLQGFKTALARVREAYNVLNSSAERAKYDDYLRKNPPAQPQTESGASTGTPTSTPTGFDIIGIPDTASHPEPAVQSGAAAPPVAVSRYAVSQETARSIDDWNRRRTDRTDLSMMGRVTRTDELGQRFDEVVRTLDVSKKGASFLTRYSARVGTVLRITLPMPLGLRLHGHADSAYNTYALVRRVRPFDGEHKLVAVEFLGAAPPRQYEDHPAAVFNVDNWSGADRRRWPRVDREEIVALRYLNESAEVIGVSLGVTENLGRRGARIRLEKPAPRFDMVRVMCAEAGFESLAALCRSYQGPDSRQRLCVNFTENEWAAL